MDEVQNIIIPPESLFEMLVRYGLYLGAGFQLMCLAACVLLPGKSDPSIKVKGFALYQVKTLFNVKSLFQQDENEESESEISTPKKPTASTAHHRRKVDKKKRR